MATFECASYRWMIGAYVYYCNTLPHSESSAIRTRSRGHHDPGSGDYWCHWNVTRRKPGRVGGKVVLGPGEYYEYRQGSEFRSMLGLEDGWEEVRLTYSGGYWSGYREIASKWFFTTTYAKNLHWTSYRVASTPGAADSPVIGHQTLIYDNDDYYGCVYVSGIYSPGGLWPGIPPGYELPDILLTPSSGVDSLLATVYTTACTSLPRNTVNNIGNIFSTIDMIKSMAGGLEGVGKLADAWLGYRYVYSTTKSDIYETVNLLDRLHSLADSTEVRSNAVEQRGNVTARCSITLSTDELDRVSSFAEKWGIQLSAYHAWDMVPYSFIVDWFLDIGGLLEFYEGYEYAMRLTPTETWFSLEVRDEAPGALDLRYYRWSGPPPLSLPGYVSHSPSVTTVLKRGLDLLALSR